MVIEIETSGFAFKNQWLLIEKPVVLHLQNNVSGIAQNGIFDIIFAGFISLISRYIKD